MRAWVDNSWGALRTSPRRARVRAAGLRGAWACVLSLGLAFAGVVPAAVAAPAHADRAVAASPVVAGPSVAGVSAVGAPAHAARPLWARPVVMADPVTGPAGCSYADSGSGVYADTICWLDMVSYNNAQSRAAAGQDMSVSLPGGLSVSFNLFTENIAGRDPKNAQPAALPVSSPPVNAWFGVDTYTGIKGKPALFQPNPGAGGPAKPGIKLTLRNIHVQDAQGDAVEDFAFVMADAQEVTEGERLIWTSDTNMTVVDRPRQQQAWGCGASVPVSHAPTTTLSCTSTTTGPRSGGYVIVRADSPTWVSQVMTGEQSGQGQGVAFGVMTANVELVKAVDSRVQPSDQFDVFVQQQGDELARAQTGAATTATTGAVTVLPGASIRLGEEATAGTGTQLAGYGNTWACTLNGVPAPELTPAPSTEVYTLPAGKLEVGNSLKCTVTNAKLPPQLTVAKTSSAVDHARVGEVVDYSVTAVSSGATGHTADQPAEVFDDLSGVLDDADLVAGSLKAAVDGVEVQAPVLTGSLLHWSGPLDAGKSVVMSYSVQVKSGGDRMASNVAFVEPADPAIPAPPAACDDGSSKVSCADFEVPALSITKTASNSVVPAVGDTLSYTVTVTNPGPWSYTAQVPATMTDDLSGVLDDAELDESSLNATVSGAPVSAPTVSDDVLSWSGPLAAGESAEVTYEVTYSGAGDQLLKNNACVPEVDAHGDACATVTTPGAMLTVSKRAEAPASQLAAGDTVAYTLSFENSGKAAARVDHTDVLDHVLDDAAVTVEPVANAAAQANLTVTRAAPQSDKIRIAGTVPPGERYEVTYTVTVKPDGERGDNLVANHLLGGAPGAYTEPNAPYGSIGAPSAPTAATCTTSNTSTCAPVSQMTYVKTVDFDAPLGDASELTYRVKITNSGEATGAVSREDVLDGVLDDATVFAQPRVTVPPASNPDSVTVTQITDGRFRIGGTLAAGETAEIEYVVKLKPQALRGDNAANNFLVVPSLDPASPTDPPATCVAGAECTATALPMIATAKSVDPASGTAVKEGDALAYTLAFENTGGAAGAVNYVDLLAGVVDDAALDPDSIVVSAPSLTARLGADNTLTVSGALAAGEEVTITYAVKVKPDGARGDNQLSNFLVPAADAPASPETPLEPASCAASSSACTVNPVGEVRGWTGVEPESKPVVAGTRLTFTLYFHNFGEAGSPVSFVDNLAHVLDDADLDVDSVTSSGLTASFAQGAGPRQGEIVVTGALAHGASATVTYTVTLRPDGQRGDDLVANFLTKGGAGSSVAPAAPICQPVNADEPNCTVTPVGMLATSKQVSASTQPVGTGTVLTYTLSFENQSTGPVAVDHVDELQSVLDDATVLTEPTASNAALQVSAIEDERFSVVGEVPAGEIYTVSYSVTVNPQAERGDNAVVNRLVAVGQTPGSDCEADANCVETLLADVRAGKAVAPASGQPVVAGQLVEYTLSFTNTGKAAGAIDYTDDLSGVLDDAVLVEAPQSSVAGVTVSSGTDGAVRVQGPIAAGQTVTVSYRVEVNDAGARGDNLLKNALVDTGTGACVALPGATCATSNPMPELAATKRVDPASGTPVVAGQQLTYTLSFSNTGSAEAELALIDDLTHVLDDAVVTGEPVASNDSVTATMQGGVIQIGGTVAAGETVTVVYAVTVNAAGQRGDNLLANFLLESGAVGPQEPSACDVNAIDCTRNPVGEILASKLADPASGTEVRAGALITYTLAFENTGAGAAAVDYTDALEGVLDDAELVSEPTASPGLTAVREADTLRVTGSLGAGEEGSVTYQVRVKEHAARGDHRLANFLTLASEPTPTECAADNSMCTQHVVEPPLGCIAGGLYCPVKPVDPVVPKPVSKLPPALTATGGQGSALAVGLGALLAVGGMLLATRKRRKL